MKTPMRLLPLTRIGFPCRCHFLLLFMFACLGVFQAPAANILWVSDTSPAHPQGINFGGMFTGPGSGLTDSAFVTLLQNAGHNVMRFNGPDNQNTNLTAAELVAINTNDLIIIGRAANSGAWRLGQAVQWNTAVTKPLICMSPYLIRTIPATTGLGPDNRMGWFTAGNLPDDTPVPATAALPADPAVDFLFRGLAMKGNSTINPYDESLDRNTSIPTDAPVVGGRTLISATFNQEGNGALATGAVLTEFPPGTVVTLSNLPLAAYRMYFSGGSREGATAPNAIPLYTGRETLTADGETLFLRAVELALSSGVPPATNPLDPVGFTIEPASATILRGRPVSFSVVLTGAAPRTVQWQRDTGDGMTFTNIPGETTTFTASRITLPAVDPADDNAKFRVVASNPNNTATSGEATLTVTPDTEPPVFLSATSLEGTNISICFDEKLNFDTATDTFGYTVVDGGNPNAVITATLRSDGRTVDLTTFTPLASPSFQLTISAMADLFGNGTAVPDTNCVNRGFAVTDIGALNPAGSHFACDANNFQLTGGGTNMLGNADQLRFLYRTIDGNFDARVRVTSIAGVDRIESFAKAALIARQDISPGAGGMTVFITPSAPGDNTVGTTVRTTSGGQAAGLGPVLGTNGLPNAWLRITRAGDVFTSYRSLDGTTWTQLGSNTMALGSPLVVGVGVNSHRNGRAVTGTFSDFIIVTGPIMGLMYNAGSFTGSFETDTGLNYQVQFKNDFSDPAWQVLTTIPGDGTVKSFTDPGPAVPQRFYRVVIQ